MAANDFTSIDYFIANSFLGKPAEGLPGFFRPSRFEVQFQLPNAVFGGNAFINATELEKILTNNIESIDMPSVEIGGTWKPFRMSLQQRFEEGQVSATFFESTNISIRESMWHWINYISAKTSDNNNTTRHFYNDIKAESIKIFPLTLDGKRIKRHVELVEVFPISISSAQMDIKSEEEIGKTTISFKFRYHKIINN